MIELDKGSGAHRHQHCSVNVDTTFNVSYAPIVFSIPQLIENKKIKTPR